MLTAKMANWTSNETKKKSDANSTNQNLALSLGNKNCSILISAAKAANISN